MLFLIGATALCAFLAFRLSKSKTLPSAAVGGDSKSEVKKMGTGVSTQNVHTLQKGSISGHVTNTTKEPIENAQVCVFVGSDKISSKEKAKPICTATDDKGFYVLDNLLPATYRPYASKKGFISRHAYSEENEVEILRLQEGGELENIDIALKPGGVEVHGVVLDIGGGAVGEAFVSLQLSWRGSGAPVSTLSDEEGKFSLWVEEGITTVHAAAAGYSGGSTEVLAPGESAEILLTPESTLSGRVIYADSKKGVPNAKVVVRSFSQFSWRGQEGGKTAISNENGDFHLEGLAPGRYKTTASIKGAFGQSPASTLLGLGESKSEISIPMHPTSNVLGRVIVDNDKNTPCPKGYVHFSRSSSIDDQTWSTIKENGTVEVDTLLPGEYNVAIECEGYISEETYPKVVVNEEAHESHNLTWSVNDTGITLKGQVVNSANESIVDASVTIAGKMSNNPRAKINRAYESTDEDGRFVAKGLIAGAVDINASANDYPENQDATKLELLEGQSPEVQITLSKGGTIYGKITSSDGTPVSGATVRATSIKQQNQFFMWAGGGNETRSDDEGNYTIEGVRPGKFRVVPSGDAWGARSMRKPGTTDDDLQGKVTHVKADQKSEVNLVVENSNAFIEGSVVDSNGNPVTDAYISSSRESDSKSASKSMSRTMTRFSLQQKPTMTDTSGHFKIEKLSKGSYALRAFRKGGGEATVDGIKTGSSVTMTIETTGSIQGKLLSSGGELPFQFKIHVNDDSTAFSRNEPFFKTQGAWKMSDLPAGKYLVSLSSSKGSASQTIELAEGEHKENIVLEIESLARLQGKFVDQESGKPIAGLMAFSQPQDGPRSFSFSDAGSKEHISNKEGLFKLKDVPLGKNMVGAFTMDKDSDYEFAMKMIDIEAGDNDVGSITLLKKRIKKGEAVGDLGFEFKQPEIGTKPDEFEFTISLIRPNGPAAESGLEVGDVVTHIDGMDITENPMNAGILMKVPPETKLVFKTKDGKEASVVAAPPRE